MCVSAVQPVGVDLFTKSSTMAHRAPPGDSFARPSLAKMSTRMNNHALPADLQLPPRTTLRQQQVRHTHTPGMPCLPASALICWACCQLLTCTHVIYFHGSTLCLNLYRHHAVMPPPAWVLPGISCKLFQGNASICLCRFCLHLVLASRVGKRSCVAR